MASKLFLVTRADLGAGAQAVQSAHAFREFAERHREIERDWYRTSNHLALLAVKNEAELAALLRAAIDRDVAVASFREPDFGNALTAIALGPCAHARAICRRLPLALSGR
jgi:hypothetical protein